MITQNLKFYLVAFYIAAVFQLVAGQQKDKQKERYIEVRGYVEMDMKPLPGAKAILYEGTNEVKSVMADNEGLFSFKLEPNKEYTIAVTRNGLITKKISFNTTLPDDEWGIWIREFAMVMVRPCEGVDYSLLEKPVDIIKYNTKRRDFESDKNYSDNIIPKLQEINLKSENCLQDKYKRLISQADQEFNKKAYEEALQTYTSASEIMPNETYPKKKIAEIEALLKKQKSSEEQYANTIAEADALYSQQRFNEALEKYKTATTIKPQDSYSLQKITEIQSILLKQQNEKQLAAANEAKYNDLIAKANQAYGQKNYSIAKQFYQDALLIKPSESLPKTRIQELDKLIEQQAQQQAQQKSVDEAYNNAIKQADALFQSKNYEAAKEAYAKALTIKPSESYPRTKTQEVERIIEQQKLAEKTAKAAEQKNKFDALLTEGDNQFKAKNYEAARAAYAEALTIKPDDEYTKQRLAAIDKNIANEQASRQKTIEDGYKNAITAGNTAMTQKQYQQAKEQYQKALTFKPGDSYATGKIAEADRLLEEQNKALAEAELRDKQYKEAIAEADRLMQAKDYQGALDGYRKALGIKPDDVYARQRITGIENTMKAEEAARLKSIEDNYRNAITAGNTAMTQKQYQQAKEQYQKALTFKPGDSYATGKIAEADELIRKEKEQLAAEQARRKQYDDAIIKADNLFSNKDYTNAKLAYESASSLYPDQIYPKNKISEINKIIEEQQKALAEKEAKESAYNNAISSGNNAYNQKRFAEAKEYYNNALKFKPDDIYAKNQIELINNIIAKQEEEKLAELARKKQYDDFIATADKAFNGANYTLAKENYQKALSIYPDNPYPKQKIARIDEITKLLSAQQSKPSQSDVKNEVAKKTSAPEPLAQLNFKDDAERDKYLNGLKKKYPEGVTLEIYKEKYKETRRYIVIRDDVATEFRDIYIKTYGGHEYSMNGKPITQMYFESQVKSRPGEYYKETVFE